MNKIALAFLSVIVLFTGCLCYHFSKEKPKDHLNDSPILVDQQIQQIKTMFFENKNLLIELQKLSEREDLENTSINKDGFLVLCDKRTLWLENISDHTKALFTAGKEDHTAVRICSASESSPTPHIEIEIYYPENQMMYTVVYSEFNLAAKDAWYRCLDDNWYLWVTGMT